LVLFVILFVDQIQSQAVYSSGSWNCDAHIYAAASQQPNAVIAYDEGAAMSTVATGWND